MIGTRSVLRCKSAKNIPFVNPSPFLVRAQWIHGMILKDLYLDLSCCKSGVGCNKQRLREWADDRQITTITNEVLISPLWS